MGMLILFRPRWLGALAVLTAAACNSSSVSPTVPSDPSNPGTAATGATIGGTVNSGGTTRMSTEGSGGSGLTVTVLGTSISSLVDSSGRFALNGVPSGNVQLRFTGTGTDARIVITGVTESERIQVAVAVSGATATIINIERTPPASTDVELKGAISSVRVGCPTPTFVVNGTTVTTTASTQFKDGSCASIASGRQVKVKGTRQSNGTVLASRVEIKEKEKEAEKEVELKGTISSVSVGCPTPTFVVNGTIITTNPATQFKKGGCASLRTGIKVEVEGTRQANGSVLASKVEIDD